MHISLCTHACACICASIGIIAVITKNWLNMSKRFCKQFWALWIVWQAKWITFGVLVVVYRSLIEKVNIVRSIGENLWILRSLKLLNPKVDSMLFSLRILHFRSLGPVAMFVIEDLTPYGNAITGFSNESLIVETPLTVNDS